MPLYVVPRTRAWLTEEELTADMDCLPAVTAALPGGVRWIHSYIVHEDDGALSAYCVYDADDEQALIRHGEALGLPTDAIKPVFASLRPATV
ncbi:MAG TPA: nickel-binding protein [Solirubrobacter sp.]|nr:nickel-binding protein [Solirubrobacter sp.]